MTRSARSPLSRIWPLVLICLMPIAAATLLATTRAGRATLERLTGTAETTDLFPGLTVEGAPPPRAGIVVTSLRSDSAAAAAGIAVGDDIVAIDDHPVTTLDQAEAYLHRDRRGTIVLRVVHAGHVRRIGLGRNGAIAHGA